MNIPTEHYIEDIFNIDGHGNLTINRLLFFRLQFGNSKLIIDRYTIISFFELNTVYDKLGATEIYYISTMFLRWLDVNADQIDNILLGKIFHSDFYYNGGSIRRFKCMLYNYNVVVKRYVDRIKLTKGELLWIK